MKIYHDEELKMDIMVDCADKNREDDIIMLFHSLRGAILSDQVERFKEVQRNLALELRENCI